MLVLKGITGTDDRRSAPLLDMGVHAIDAALSVLGPAHSVSQRSQHSALMRCCSFGCVLCVFSA